MAEPRAIPDDSGVPNFPAGLEGYERHFLGRFGERVVAYLGRGDSPGKIHDQDVFLVVDAIELGDNPYHEEIGIDFHLSPSPPPADYVPHWGALAPSTRVERDFESESPCKAARYSFVFSSAMSLAENEAEFLDFLKDEAGLIVPANSVAHFGGKAVHLPEGTRPSPGGDVNPSGANEPKSRRSAS